MMTSEHLSFEPLHFTVPAPWAGHIPFAHWLIANQKPYLFVELGAYSGISYMSFCQSIVQNKISTQAWAIDTWQGDPHAGFYSDAVYTGLRDKHNPLYGHFSTLHKATFDDSLALFADGSIDLLHIDGLHTYEAVKHDFESWTCKLSPRAVVLFHDTHVFHSDFGVYRLWRELEHLHPSINFAHSNGLGVLLFGPKQPQSLLDLCTKDKQAEHLEIFAKLGDRLESRALRMQMDQQLADLQTALTQEKQSGQIRHDWITQQDLKILDLERRLTSFDMQQQALLSAEDQRDALQRELLKTQNQCHALQRDVLDAHQHSLSLKNQIDNIVSTKSWRLTRGLRQASSSLRTSKQFLKRCLKALAYVRRGDFTGLKHRIAALRQDERSAYLQGKIASDKPLHFAVMTPPHTLFLAQLIATRLAHHGWTVDILTTELNVFDHDLYFVLCPQFFKKHPPGEKRIVYQLEQSVSSRWFTEDYLSLLSNSLSVLDYNLDNIRFLSEKGIQYPHVYYMPMGSQTLTVQPASADYEFDILFYGDSASSPRRQKLLHALQQHYKVEIANDIFGEAMREKIRKAKLVINLHYYDNALLETPRIQECLSIGTRVVSESSSNQSEFPYLQSVVRFFQEGSIPDMLKVVKEALDQPVSFEALQLAAQCGQTQFNFFLDRFLLGRDLMGNNGAKAMVLPLQPQASMFCLSLPETPSRRDLFLAEPPQNCEIYDGLRKTPGWVGCGLSYASLARHAIQNNFDSITVMEDDVILPPHFEDELAIVHRYLAKKNEQWDIFSGLIASVHPSTEILDVEVFEDRTFVTINKMTSTVFNIYTRKFLSILESWDSDDRDSSRNTIDRFIEHKENLRIVVQLPFLTGHREEVSSTLWGFQNTQYSDWIANSQATLEKLVEDWHTKRTVL